MPDSGHRNAGLRPHPDRPVTVPQRDFRRLLQGEWEGLEGLTSAISCAFA
jgi:hypothetical protein